MSELRDRLLKVLAEHTVASDSTTTYCHCGWSGRNEDYDQHLAGAIAEVSKEKTEYD